MRTALGPTLENDRKRSKLIIILIKNRTMQSKAQERVKTLYLAIVQSKFILDPDKK